MFLEPDEAQDAIQTQHRLALARVIQAFGGLEVNSVRFAQAVLTRAEPSFGMEIHKALNNETRFFELCRLVIGNRTNYSDEIRTEAEELFKRAIGLLGERNRAVHSFSFMRRSGEWRRASSRDVWEDSKPGSSTEELETLAARAEAASRDLFELFLKLREA